MAKEKIKKIFTYAIFSYVILVIAFYFLAGDQLKYRDSRKNINMPVTELATDEVVYDYIVEQTFTNFIDRLSEIQIACTTHYRQCYGELTIEVLDGQKVLMSTKKNLYYVKEGDNLVVRSKEPLEGYTGRELTIRIFSTSPRNYALSLLMTRDNSIGNIKLGEYYSDKSLCFSAYGQEYIFTGQYYWLLMGIVGLFFSLILFVSYQRYCHKKVSIICLVLTVIEKYRFLIKQLVTRDFKTKYKRSVLGVFWSFLNPLLTMVVQYIVFSTFFKTDTANYPVYLLIGVVCFSFFNETTTMGLQSIVTNANLITKVYIPKYIFPFSRTLSSGINLVISLIPLIIVSVLTGVVFSKAAILSLYFIVCLIIFSLGIGLILSTLMVFFRDVQFLWSVMVMIWMYATPTFYSPNIIPPKFQFILRFNPVFQYIKNIRMCIIDGISPEPIMYVLCLAAALGSLLVGSFIFKKNQDKFTLYL